MIDGRFSGIVRDVSQTLPGGEFWWPQFGVGVGIPADGVYAEIAWQGPTDYRGTLGRGIDRDIDWDTIGVNRWPCSLQITKTSEQRLDKLRRENNGLNPENRVYKSLAK